MKKFLSNFSAYIVYFNIIIMNSKYGDKAKRTQKVLTLKEKLELKASPVYCINKIFKSES